MKKKVALLLAAAMTISALPMTAFASSTNSVTKTVSVTEGEIVQSNGSLLSLNIIPKDDIESGDSIVIDIDNGKFAYDFVDKDGVRYNLLDMAQWNVDGNTWSDFMRDIQAGSTYKAAFTKYLFNHDSKELPYYINYINPSEIEVVLCPTTGLSLDSDNSGAQLTNGKPTYIINLPIVSEDSDEGDITVSIDSNDTAISNSSSITIASVTGNDGSTTASVYSKDVLTFSSSTYKVPDITIKEDVKDTFPGYSYGNAETGIIKVKVNGSYEWDPNDLPVLQDGLNCTKSFSLAGELSANGSYVTYQVDGSMFDPTKISSVIVTGGSIIVDDDDKGYGDVTVTVSGSSAGVTNETVTVGKREDYGFSLEATEAAPSIFAGRTPIDYDGGLNDLDQDDFKTAIFRFSETSPDTWLTSRKVEFTVPEGVKIIGYDVDDTEKINESGLEGKFKISNTGSSLRIEALGDNVVNKDKVSSIDIALYVTAEATYTGDITVSASGAGLDADKLSPVTIATAVSPISVEAGTTFTNIGYQKVETKDIVIKEAATAALMEDEYVVIKMDTVYGDNELGFSAEDAEIEVDGDIEIKDFKVNSGAIKFKVEHESYSGPSTLTLKNMVVGTTRSIPYGSYDLLVGGDAVVNNYLDNVDQSSTVSCTGLKTEPEELSDEKDFGFFDTDEGIKASNPYITVKTETGTLDARVEVPVDEPGKIVIDGQSYEMDAKAYIQESSDSIMVPVRFVALAIGVDSEAAQSTDTADNSSKILWDANAKECTVLYAAGNGMKIVKFRADSPEMTIDGTPVTMANGVVSEIVDGRMYVPFRALGQALGVEVYWDEASRTGIYNPDKVVSGTAVADKSAETATPEQGVEETTAAE